MLVYNSESQTKFSSNIFLKLSLSIHYVEIYKIIYVNYCDSFKKVIRLKLYTNDFFFNSHVMNWTSLTLMMKLFIYLFIYLLFVKWLELYLKVLA